jgi:hypothetical protein
MLAGTEDHATYCGTLTMTEDEWDTFLWALRLGDRIGVVDEAQQTEDEKERRREAI